MTKVLTAFLVLVVGGGLLIGYLTAPGEWYARLAKPSFTPSGWLFAPVWTALYILIAIAGYRVAVRNGPPLLAILWAAQLALNFAWSPVFFTAHWVGAALIIVLLLLVTIVVFVAASWQREPVAAWMFVPYAAWVAFASVLNGAILLLNKSPT
jgi:tryptophan-rich sensory protein